MEGGRDGDARAGRDETGGTGPNTNVGKEERGGGGLFSNPIENEGQSEKRKTNGM